MSKASHRVPFVRCHLRLITWIAAALLCTPGFSQGLYNTATLHVDGASIYVDGTLTSEGTLDNNGWVSLTGDWKCTGSYFGKGTVEAIGTSRQQIKHQSQDIFRFMVNGEGVKDIIGTLTIANRLLLQRGVIEVSASDALVMTEDASIWGGSPESFIDGPLTVSGTGYKFFPVGKDNTYAPIEFIDVAGARARYAVELFKGAPVVIVDGVTVQRRYYWQRTDLEGTFGGSVVALPNPQRPFQRQVRGVLVTGSEWSKTFQVIRDLDYSEEGRISSHRRIFDPLILLGQLSSEWNEAGFYLSTALSPHAQQSENRSVKVFGDRLAADHFSFQVFNRRGELIYESRSLDEMTNNGWDGRTINGKPLMGGAYPYRLTGIETSGSTFEKSGIITIVY